MAIGNARKTEFIEGRRKARWSRGLAGEQGAIDERAADLFARHAETRNRSAARDDEQAIALCDGIIDLVGAFFNVSTRELRQAGRTGLQAAQVRQIAMYVAHVVLQLTMRQVGLGFQRDRTTVLHACHLVEDMRDDIEFDRIVAHVERVVAAAFGMDREP